MPLDGAKLNEVTKRLITGRGRIERGWCQRHLHDGEAFCIIGAVYGSAYPEVYERLGRAIGVEIKIGTPNDLEPIARWNDAPERTKEQVLEAFDRAITESL